MRYFEAAPSSPLADFVQCFWYLDKFYDETGQPGEWIFPDGTTDLVFQRRGGFAIGSSPLPDNFFVGPRRTPLLLRCQGRAVVVGVRFHAHGAYHLFDRPLAPLLDRVVPLSDLTDRKPARKLPATPWAAFAALDRFLLSDLPALRGLTARLNRCVRWLQRTQGSSPIAALAAHVRLSPRQLERQFRPATGFSPKQLARIYRFNAVRDRLMLEPGASFTDVAHAADYHDQSHFIHDFRDLAGLPPTGFTREVAVGKIRFNG